ncbi:MAG: carboxypeptidase-like regulatory domain-containing protein, partial [Planctomycetota bacterium]
MRALLVLLAVGLIVLLAWITFSDSPPDEPAFDRPEEEEVRTRLEAPPVVEPDPSPAGPAKEDSPKPAAGDRPEATPPAAEPIVSLRGHVLDADDEGVAGVWVRSSESMRSGSAETAADGSFTLGVTAGPHVLTVAGIGVRSPEGGVEVTAPA